MLLEVPKTVMVQAVKSPRSEEASMVVSFRVAMLHKMLTIAISVTRMKKMTSREIRKLLVQLKTVNLLE